jgi:hypothetical protein
VAELDALREGALFGAVTFWDVLEHVPNPLSLLSAAWTRLESGGLCAATMPNAHGTTAWLHGGRWKYYDLAEYGHLFHLSLAGLSAFFRRAGFQVVLARTTGSTDLRFVPEVRGGSPPGRATAAALDRLSGLVARLAPRLGYGDTQLVVGRRP